MHSDFLGKLRQLMTLLLGDRRLQGLGYPGLPEDQVLLLSGGGGVCGSLCWLLSFVGSDVRYVVDVFFSLCCCCLSRLPRTS